MVQAKEAEETAQSSETENILPGQVEMDTSVPSEKTEDESLPAEEKGAEELDYKALWEARTAQDAEIEAKRLRDEENARSLKTSLLRQAARDKEQLEQAKVQREILALLKQKEQGGEVTGETITEVETIQRRGRAAVQAVAASEQSAVSTEKGQEVLGILQEKTPEGMSLETSPELQDVKNRFNRGYDLHTKGNYDMAMDEFDDALREMDRWQKRHEKDVALAVREAALAEREKEAETDALNMGVPRSVGANGSGSVSWATAQKIGSLDALSDEAYEKLTR